MSEVEFKFQWNDKLTRWECMFVKGENCWPFYFHKDMRMNSLMEGFKSRLKDAQEYEEGDQCA